MSRTRVTTVLLAGAIGVLLVALVLRVADVLSEGALDALAVAGLGLLAAGQAVRLSYDRRPRTLLILLLVLALLALVLYD